jgi:hypothetical protein
MAESSASAPSKPDDSASLHSTSQDSAVRLSEHSPPPPPPPQQHQHQHQHEQSAADSWPLSHDPPPADLQEQYDFAHDPYDNASDSGFDSGSLLGDETDTLASSIMNYRIENGRQYHAYRDGAYWGAWC